jgi:outer membrane receptor protein involved in Fe transport
MKNYKKKALALGVILPSLAFGVFAEEAMEEVVVTGSYIKRDSFDSASPLTIVNQEAIAAQAVANLGEVFVNQTFNYGSDFQTNTYAARGQGGVTTSANIRGLGARATLPLIDGKRTIQSNFNNAIPQVAIERIDILKDGASALYGTDAVAGVVNIITRKNFSGTKFSAFYTQDTDNDHHENVFDFISGADTDNGHITMAGSFRRRTELTQVERPEFLRKGFERSSTGNPGDWNVPNRDATGQLDGTTARHVDPGCGVSPESSPGGTDVGSYLNNLTGDVVGSVATATNCRLHFGEFWNFMNPNEQYSGWMNYQYKFSDNLSNEIDLTISRLITDSRGSPQNPGGRTEEFPIVLGDHPGNPFRAYSDLDGNGLIGAGEQLYAADANGDGIPDRGTVDLNGDGVLDVVLAADPFDATQGVPFNEDVDVVALRIFGKTGLLAGGNQPTSLNADGSNTGNATFDAINYRLTDTLTYSIPDTSWQVSGIAIFQRDHLVFEQKNTSQGALVAGLNGDLKATQSDVTTSYWNPFATQSLNCVNRVCLDTGTADFANSVDVLDAVNIQANDVTDTEFWSIDTIATGDLFDLPSGTVASAFGLQYRKTQINEDLDAARNACDWHEGGCGYDWTASQDVGAAFFEIQVPALDNLELTIAGRYSDYGGTIGDSFDPKFSFLYRPTDGFSVRASWSSAFVAPSIRQLDEPENCGLETANDPVAGDSSNSFRVACVAGNSLLVPEEADVWNVGFSGSVLDGSLNFGIDYTSYDFTNRISQTSMNQVLRLDAINYSAAGFTLGNIPDVLTWVADPRSDKNINRDSTGLVTRVTTQLLNAQSMNVAAFDLYANYNFAFNSFGNYTVGVEATLADKYEYDLGAGIPPGDGVGVQNEDVVEVPPIPEWRVTGTLNWFMNNHAALIRLRYTDGFDLDFNSKALQGGQAFFNGTLEMDSILYTDLNYSYTFDNLLGDRESKIEIGGRNIFDEFPDPIFNLGGIETFVHDVRGRTWYLKVSQDI